MDFSVKLLLLLSFIWACIQLIKERSSRRKAGTAAIPPGPYPFPIIGNIFELGDNPHQSLAKLSKTYGPVMSLKLGSKTTVILSSTKAAKEVLQKHDQILSGRSVADAARAFNHHQFSMVWLPAAGQWRNLRKICAMELFTLQRLNAGQALRQEKVQELLKHVHESCMSGEAVDIGGAAFTTSLNLLSNTLFSIDLANYNSEKSQEFKVLVWEFMEKFGTPNLADFFPALSFIDPQGVRKSVKVIMRKLFGIFEEIINQRLELRANSSPSSSDLLDALLNLNSKNNSEMSFDNMKHLLLDMFIGGTDTNSSTLEWAMVQLLRNPKTMAKVQAELREVLNEDTPIQESDIAKLPYLQAVVKETFRLHQPGPIIFHQADADAEICGFKVPKGAQIGINLWGMSRDPDTWTDPNAFVPERFLGSTIDVKGHDFELIPFGSGRRICPGLPLAHRMVHLMLASLLHKFDWKLEDGVKPEDIDMVEKFGLTLHKAKPLMVVPVKV